MNQKQWQQLQAQEVQVNNVVLFSEVLTKVNNAKDKPKKIAVLQQYDNAPLRQVLKGAFDPNIEWDLQQVTPYINEAHDWY